MRHPFRVWLCAMIAPLLGGTRPDVVVHAGDATVQRIMFDPSHPPDDMPPLRDHGAAMTQSDFQCSVDVTYRRSNDAPAPGAIEATIEIGNVTIELGLTDRVYLPEQATPALRAHEEGHVRINEQVYAQAETIARSVVGENLAKSWTARGASADAAAKAASDAAIHAISSAYLHRTSDRASAVGDAYDKLTDHGRNTSIAVPDAIREAFQQAPRSASAP